RPEQPLSTLLGKPAGGTWKLRVEDALAEDTGTLHCWQLDILRDTVNVPPPVTTTTSTSTTTTTAPPPPTLQAPFTSWARPGATTLDGLGSWIATANDPTAKTGQVAPAYLYAHLFGFSANPATGAIALGTGPTGKFALFTVQEPPGISHDVAVAFPWSAGRFYFPLVHQISPGVWGAWVYDHTAETWTFVGQLSLPAGWGKLTPASTTGVLWYGGTAASCPAYPLADVFFAPPTGFAAGTITTATGGAHHASTAGCPAVATTEAGWARYRVGT
ncbi:MAG TPA: proprotein convertase P-domain-containing protein, partial [Acidimicrobiales bacterium]